MLISNKYPIKKYTTYTKLFVIFNWCKQFEVKIMNYKLSFFSFLFHIYLCLEAISLANNQEEHRIESSDHGANRYATKVMKVPLIIYFI